MMRHLAWGALLMASMFEASAGSVYTWVDDDGRVHYGDRPISQDASKMRVRPSPGRTSEGSRVSEESRREKQRRLLNAYEKERADKKAAAEKAKESRKQRTRNCSVAKDRLRAIREAGYLYDLDKYGNRTVYSDARRRDATAQAKRDVSRWCK